MKLKHIGWVSASAIAVLTMVFSILINIEITKSTYATYEELASIPNIFESGWVPRWLPKTATQIKESHDIDTNESWLIFDFSTPEKFYENCRVIEEGDAELPAEKQVSKFPSFVVESLSKIRESTVTFYRCDDAVSRNMAVDHINARAYVWSTPF